MYYVGQGTESADFSSVEGFNQYLVSDVSGGTFSNGVFYFDGGSDTIEYAYLLSNDVYGHFLIKYK